MSTPKDNWAVHYFVLFRFGEWLCKPVLSVGSPWADVMYTSVAYGPVDNKLPLLGTMGPNSAYLRATSTGIVLTLSPKKFLFTFKCFF